jgi:hypothetical protein
MLPHFGVVAHNWTLDMNKHFECQLARIGLNRGTPLTGGFGVCLTAKER